MLETLKANPEALQYQGTILIEILKNQSKDKLDLLDKSIIENEIITALDRYIQFKMLTELKKKKYEPEKFKFAIEILNIHKDVYPYTIHCILYFLQKKGKKANLKKEFFQKVQSYFLIQMPSKIQDRSISDIVYNWFVHFKKVKDLNEEKTKNPAQQKGYYEYVIGEIGHGQFGQVSLVKCNDGKVYAMKEIQIGYQRSYETIPYIEKTYKHKNTSEKSQIFDEMQKEELVRQQKLLQEFLASSQSADFSTKRAITQQDLINKFGQYNNPIRELYMFQKLQNIQGALKLHKVFLDEKMEKLYLITDYFGPVSIEDSSIYDYFGKNYATNLEFKIVGTKEQLEDIPHLEHNHQDLFENNFLKGRKNICKATADIFMQILDITEKFHQANIGLRGNNDMDILVARKEDYKFVIRFCDYGLYYDMSQPFEFFQHYMEGTEYIPFIHPQLNKKYEEIKSKPYRPVYDFFGLGYLLKKITVLFRVPLGLDVPFDFEDNQDQQLIDFLQQDNSIENYDKLIVKYVNEKDPNDTKLDKDGQYPQSIAELRKTRVFQNWIKRRQEVIEKK